MLQVHWLTQKALQQIHSAHTVFEKQSWEYPLLVLITDDNVNLNRS